MGIGVILCKKKTFVNKENEQMSKRIIFNHRKSKVTKFAYDKYVPHS